MAGKKSKKRHTKRASTRSNPPSHAKRSHTKRRHRRNPSLHGTLVRARSVGAAIKRLPQFALHSGIKAGGALGGVIAARKLRGLAKQQAGSMFGGLIEAAVGVVGGSLISIVAPNLGEGFAIGGILAPAMTLVQNMKIPHVSDSLGDDGYLIGGDSGVTLVSAFPDDYATMAAYNEDGLGRYAQPIARRPQLVTVADKHESKFAA